MRLIAIVHLLTLHNTMVLSERRKQKTLLDMVRYMEVKQSSKNILGYYALETAALILNMILLPSPDKLERRSIKCSLRQESIGIYMVILSTTHLERKSLLSAVLRYRIILDPESDKWLNAMNVEIQSMKDNEVWDLVELPPNGKTVGSNWLFKKKTDMDGAVHTYKACLMVKGYTQSPKGH
ncbi:retrotransposon protein, putative, ty1-copia subclass [Tanacetum coccineum]